MAQTQAKLHPVETEERVLRRGDLADFLGIGRTASYAATSQPGFPKPVNLFGSTQGWLQSEVVDFLKSTRK